MDYKQAEKTLDTLDVARKGRYENYFDSLRPLTANDKLRRGLFALASVHTTWESNIKLYAKLWDLNWEANPDLLRDRIIESRAGLVNGRVKAVMRFTAMFRQYPQQVERAEGETWYDYRDRLSEMILGLGPAKSAFFIELMHFHDSRISCFDTHMLQAYAIAPKDVGKVKPSELARMEMHWDMSCAKRDINPVTARWILWDQKQGKLNSRYWSYVLEGKPEIIDEQMELFSGEEIKGKKAA